MLGETESILLRVNDLWLLKQCKNQFHRYLRLSGKYIDFYSLCREVTLVGSESWVNLVSKEFILISEECCNYMDGRMFLREDEEKTDVEALASKLIEKVEEDGGTHISVGLLLHRYPELQKNVGGRDLMRLKEENEAYFDRIGIFMRDNQIYLQSKITKEGRMQVDETGLFSVTSSKWGNAFVSMMAHQCRSMLSKEPGTVVAIDLTASVGGITLPLAKTFERVIAIEIDSHRAELCHCNMVEYGVSHNVNIRNEDSVEIISDVGEELGQYPRVVVIDPPWGGKHYKSEDRKKPIMMGQWDMIQVMKRISNHLSPTVVGIRMPVFFETKEFLHQLKDSDISVHGVDVKKAGPQIFIILSI